MPRLPLAAAALTLAAAALAPLPAAAFGLSSPDVKPGSMLAEDFVYNGQGCSGQNRSPALQWGEAPAGAQSYAVTVHDPDAPGGAGWWHWVVVNIPASATGIVAGAGTANSSALPAGATQARNDFGTPAWGGACPPAGDKPHRYVFTVYALKAPKLEIPASATGAQADALIKANQMGMSSFTVLYSRAR